MLVSKRFSVWMTGGWQREVLNGSHKAKDRSGEPWRDDLLELEERWREGESD